MLNSPTLPTKLRMRLNRQCLLFVLMRTEIVFTSFSSHCSLERRKNKRIRKLTRNLVAIVIVRSAHFYPSSFCADSIASVVTTWSFYKPSSKEHVRASIRSKTSLTGMSMGTGILPRSQDPSQPRNEIPLNRSRAFSNHLIDQYRRDVARRRVYDLANQLAYDGTRKGRRQEQVMRGRQPLCLDSDPRPISSPDMWPHFVYFTV